MREILPHMFNSIRNEMELLAVIFVAAIVIGYVQWQIDIVNSIYEAIQEKIRNEDHPELNDLQELTTFRRFRKAQPEFQRAVREKIEAHNITPTAIEKTMSPAQLYKAKNPLWMTGFSVEFIRVVFILEGKLGRNIVANDYINEFMLDYKNGTKPFTALEKQLQKQEIN